jgi:hypothetical protein
MQECNIPESGDLWINVFCKTIKRNGAIKASKRIRKINAGLDLY